MFWFWFWWVMIAADAVWWVVAARLTKRRLWRVMVATCFLSGSTRRRKSSTSLCVARKPKADSTATCRLNMPPSGMRYFGTRRYRLLCIPIGGCRLRRRPERVSQVTWWFFWCALTPLTPTGSAGAKVRCFPVDGRLRIFWELGRREWFNEAETSSPLSGFGLTPSSSGRVSPFAWIFPNRIVPRVSLLPPADA